MYTCDVCGAKMPNKSRWSHKGSTQCEVNVILNNQKQRNLYPVLRRHIAMLKRNGIVFEMNVGACRGDEKIQVPFVERPVEYLCMNLKNKSLKWALRKYGSDEMFRSTFSSALEIGDDGLGARDVLNYVLDQYAEEHSVKIPKLDQELEVLRESLRERLTMIDDEIIKSHDPMSTDGTYVKSFSEAVELGNWSLLKRGLSACQKVGMLDMREYRLLEDVCNVMMAHQRRYFEAGLLR